MEFGLALPNLGAGSSAEGIEAAAEVAERLGYTTVWTTDHIVTDRAAAPVYGRIFEAILTLAHLAGRTEKVKLGVSVIVVPQRQAVLVAKELATLDVLSRGRVIAGVWVGWNKTEMANVEMGDRFTVRGAYADETIAVWRHLWSGSTEPFEGRFNHLTDFVFDPLPVQPGGPPIVVGGSSAPAFRRAGTLGDAYHFSVASPAVVATRLPVVRAAAEAAGRPMPPVSGRARVRFDSKPPEGDPYTMAGTPEEIATEVRAFEALGVSHIVLVLNETNTEKYVAIAERFHDEVIPLLG
jgi:probable F420-dependent oxidoreductase